ncbi:MAG: tyrosine-type recombinase/integrase [Chitinophagaceae bacterium]|nr:tyrosine-type recombinase/integrase [Chitinophagaceae bacterium]
MVSSQYIHSFLDYLKYEKRYSRHTIVSYETDLLAFFDYLEHNNGAIGLKQINHGQIRSWLAGLREDGIKTKTINRKISTLKSFFKFHIKAGSVETTPMAKIISPKNGSQLPAFVREDDTRRLIKTLSVSSEDWKSLNARILITMFYATGMRLSELLQLKETQLDLGKGQIKVLGKGNKERIIPIPNEIQELVIEYQSQKRKNFAGENEFLLVTEKGKPIYPKYAYTLVNKYLGTVSTLNKKSPHVLRHTFATHLMNNGADLNAVKELLGHSSLASTQVYTHNTIEKLKDIHKKSHPKA